MTYSPRVAVKLDAALLEDVISLQGDVAKLNCRALYISRAGDGEAGSCDGVGCSNGEAGCVCSGDCRQPKQRNSSMSILSLPTSGAWK